MTGRGHGRRRGGGFTIIELLVVVGVIGILAAMLMPLFLDGLQKAKQKRTLSELNLTGSASMAWLTDQLAAAAAGASAVPPLDVTDFGPVLTADEVALFIVPQYIQAVPIQDGWRNPYEYRVNTDLRAEQVILIRSPAFDGVFSGDTYVAEPFEANDYEQDLVWSDGFFVRWPRKLNP